MSHIQITAKDHVKPALVIRTSTGLQNVVPGTPLTLPLIDLEAVGKQCREADYDVQVVEGDTPKEAAPKKKNRPTKMKG